MAARGVSFASLLQNQLCDLWKSSDSQALDNTRDTLKLWEMHGIQVTEQEVDWALQYLKHKNNVDDYGVSLAGIRAIFDVRPFLVLRMLWALATEDCTMAQVMVTGRAKAKQAGAVPASKVRSIMPLPKLLIVLDVVVGLRINAYADAWAARLPCGYLEAATRGRQKKK